MRGYCPFVLRNLKYTKGINSLRHNDEFYIMMYFSIDNMKKGCYNRNCNQLDAVKIIAKYCKACSRLIKTNPISFNDGMRL